MRIYLYITDHGDGSLGILYFKSAEDRQKRKNYEENSGWAVWDGCDDYMIDTDDVPIFERG